MSIIKFESKNLKAIAVLTFMGFLGTVLMITLTRYYNAHSLSPADNPYLMALQPLLFAGVPMMMLIAFIVAVFAVAREDSPTARFQAVSLMVILLILAYVFSFTLLNSGVF